MNIIEMTYDNQISDIRQSIFDLRYPTIRKSEIAYQKMENRTSDIGKSDIVFPPLFFGFFL